MLAAAENDILVLFCDEGNREKFSPLMRPIAKRLLGRASAAAPQISLASFDLEIITYVIGDYRL